jgi:hypothetical protein
MLSYTPLGKGATVVWDIDSAQSFIRLEVPDQLVPINGFPQLLGLRDFSPDPQSLSTNWTDDGGKRSFVTGTLQTEYISGTSIGFSSGQQSAAAIQFGSFRPDPAAWNGTTFDPNTGAPAAFGAAIHLLFPEFQIELPAGDVALRDILYDLSGSVSLAPSGNGWIGSNSFLVGIAPGARADVQGAINEFNQTLGDPVLEENGGSLAIENLGGGSLRLTLLINVPVTLAVEGVDIQASVAGQIVANATVSEPASVVGSSVFHAGFSGAGTPPDNAIDSGKLLAKEGSGATLSFANVINTSRGINGLVFDIQNLANGAALGPSDFEVLVSPQGAFNAAANPPAGWPVGPAPTSVTVTAGSPDRVRIEWPNGSIVNRWLRLTIKANANTGLSAPETYYLGHLLGETTGLAGGSVYTVAFADITPIRSTVGTTVNASSVTDIDKNGTVAFADISAMRPNVGAQLTNITIP